MLKRLPIYRSYRLTYMKTTGASAGRAIYFD
jgi:hypothetical protein